MRNFLLVLAALGSVRVHARAEPAVAPVVAAASAPVAETPSSRFALAVNAPLGWAIGSFGVSGYVRFGEHLAVRGNLASYQNGNLLGALGDGGTGYGGTISDVGIAGVWYPRRVWDGPYSKSECSGAIARSTCGPSSRARPSRKARNMPVARWSAGAG